MNPPVNINAGGQIFTVSFSVLNNFKYFETLFYSQYKKDCIFLDVDPEVFSNWISHVRSAHHKIPKNLRLKVEELDSYLKCEECKYKEPQKYYEIVRSTKCQVSEIYTDFLNFTLLPRKNKDKENVFRKISEVFVGFSQKQRHRGEDLSKEGLTVKVDSKIVYFLRADEIPMFSENVSSTCINSPFFENCVYVYKINKKMVKLFNSLLHGKNVEIFFRHNGGLTGGFMINLQYYTF